MILYRCLAWNKRAAPDSPDGSLWFPRLYQGEGRHDNPDVYGCLYLSEAPLSCIVEQLARGAIKMDQHPLQAQLITTERVIL